VRALPLLAIELQAYGPSLDQLSVALAVPQRLMLERSVITTPL
jgi:hypothetical protein